MQSLRDTPRVTSRGTLGQWDAVAIIVGIVVGAGIFRFPSFVAGSVENATTFLLLWMAGGLVALVGALVYAELASAFPSSGGEYHFLTRAYGPSTGFLFAWARMAVMQTGSIALVGFVFGDYATQIVPLGAYSASIYAAVAILILTTLNIAGAWQGKWTQNVLTTLILIGLLAAVAAGFGASAPAPQTGIGGAAAYGSAMIFILLTYGGWNEAAYLSGEMRDVRRTMLRALLVGIAIITSIYLLVNLAYLRVLGLEGIRDSPAVGADLLRATVGEEGAILFSVVIGIALLSTLNATIFTGARTNYALGRDFAVLAYMGRWKSEGETPANALLVQGGIALALVAFGTLGARSGVESMVDYTAPVFWFFFLLAGVSLFVLRAREPEVVRPFRVPAYPVIPLLFAGACLFMLYSSLDFVGARALIGLAVVAAGVPILLLGRRRTTPQP